MSCSRDNIQDIWGDRTPYAGEGEWPVRVDENIQAEPDAWVQSCCVLCTNGCGLDIGRPRESRPLGAQGTSWLAG